MPGCGECGTWAYAEAYLCPVHHRQQQRLNTLGVRRADAFSLPLGAT